MNEYENSPGEQAEINERKENLKESFGVALSTKQKSGETESLESQAEMAENMALKSVQFDFRHRTLEEIEGSRQALENYRQQNPDALLSIHGDTPEIDQVSLDYANKFKIAKELAIASDLGSESYTVHPPAIKQALYYEQEAGVREQLINNYVNLFIEQLLKSAAESKNFSIAIENMPDIGDEGSFGQTPEALLALIQKIIEALVARGMEATQAASLVGATLDINHTLDGKRPDEYSQVLGAWFAKLGKFLKVVHIYTPSKSGTEFTDKYNLALELAAKYSPAARLFMESKQTPETTQELFNAVKAK